MLVLLALLALALAAVVYVALRHRITFLIGLRNIPRRRSQTTLIVLGLMLSTLIISAAFTTGDTVFRSVAAEAYEVLGHVDETVLLGEGLLGGDSHEGTDIFVRRKPVPQSLVADLEKRLQGNNEVNGLTPVLAEPVAVLNPRSRQSEPLAVLVGIDASRLDAFPDIVDRDHGAVDVAALADDELLVNESLADELSAEPGDTLEVYFQNQRFPFRVADVVRDRLLTGATPFRRLGMVTRIEALQESFGREAEADFIAISNRGGVRDGLSLSDSVTAELSALLSDEPYNVEPIKADVVEAAEDMSSAMVLIFMLLGLFSVAAGILLIFMIFVMLAAERKSEMGISRALGMKRRHLVEMFLAEGMGYNLVAAMVGVALGVLASLAMTRIMAILFAQFDLAITFHVTWRSLIVSYSLGVVLTFVTVAFSSWRVSALNIVRAIRDLPEPRVARASRRALYLGIAGGLLGVLLSWAGLASAQQFPFALGMTLVILGLVPILRYGGVRERPVFTSVGLALLLVWTLGAGGYLEALTGEMEGGYGMFFLSGLVMVLATTFVLVYNADLMLRLLERLGGTTRRLLPAVRTAVAYPLASKFRTGMAMAMISLVVFALVVMSTMNTNFDRVFLSNEARGGWDVAVQENPGNPLVNLRQALADAPGVDTARFEAVGRVEPVVSRSITVRQGPDEEFASYPVRGLDHEFLMENRIELQARASGFEDDRAVWEAMADDPSLAVIDAFSLAGFGFGPRDADFILEGVDQEQRTFDRLTLEIRDDLTRRTKEVTLAGIISTGTSATFTGLYTGQKTIRQVSDLDHPDFTIYFVRLESGEDAKATAQAIEAALLTRGAQAESIKDEMEEQQRLSNGFFWLLQGFMGLGLLVGTAAVGVIAFRTVVERRKQIGMLRAIGYQRSMVGFSFLLESSFVTLLGVLSGVGLGILLAFLLLNGEDSQAMGIDTFVLPWRQILLIMAFAYGSSLIMSVIPSRRAASLTIADALRYE
jgi:putative ABC transport system permease protein